MKKKTSLSQFPSELKKALDNVLSELTSKDNMQSIGDDLAEQIRIRTRLGQGLEKNRGEPSKLRPLSSSYIEQRKKMPELSGLTSAKKSNLTLTGQMLDDLEAQADTAQVTLTFKDQASKDKARWNTESGRPFLAVSRVQIQRLENSLRLKIQTLLKKYFP